MSETIPEAVQAPPAAPAPTEPPVQQQPPAPGQEPPAPAAASTDELPSWAQRELKKLRDEAASNRVKAKEAADAATAQVQQLREAQEAQRIALGKALGLVADEPPTAEQLAEKLGAAQAETAAERDRARAAAVELAVLRTAARHQADGDALLDSRAFASQLTGLDPSAPDFAQRVDAAITAAVEAQPRYKLAAAAAPEPPPPPEPQSATTAPPARSGGEHNGAPGGQRQWTLEDVQSASPAETAEALKAGLLVGLGIKAPKSRR